MRNNGTAGIYIKKAFLNMHYFVRIECEAKTLSPSIIITKHNTCVIIRFKRNILAVPTISNHVYTSSIPGYSGIA